MSSAPLHVAVADGIHPYWLALLQRSGLPVRTLGATATDAATLFLPDRAGLGSRTLRQRVARLREQGTPVLAGAAWGQALGAPVAGEAGAFQSLCSAAAVRRLDPAPLLVLPLPAAEHLLRAAAQLTTLAGPGPAAPREVIALADHGGLRRCIEAGLRSLAFAAGRPFVRLALHPRGHDGTFAFRIDADDFRPEATAASLRALAAARLRATWFVDVERHEQRGGLPELRTIAAAGHELQSHYYRHYTYRSAGRNTANLARSLAVLAQHGVTATAAATPFGTWNPGVETALRRCGLQWSSEFSRSHDDVPGPLSGTAGEPWQVPVHPVCPALLLTAGASLGEVHAWFVHELQDCLQRGEPAVLYGHPIADLEPCPELLPELAAVARRHTKALWQPTLGELHDFYRRRAAQPIDVHFDGDTVAGATIGPAALLVERPEVPAVVLDTPFELPVQPTVHSAGALLTPAPYQPRATQRDRFATRRLQLARLVRELRT